MDAHNAEMIHKYHQIIYPKTINYKETDENEDDEIEEEKIIQIPENERDDILNKFISIADPDSCRDEWSRIIRALFNLGASTQLIHKWSSISQTKYNNSAKRTIDKLKETSFCGIQILVSHLKKLPKTEPLIELKNKLISYLPPKPKKPFDINEYLLRPYQQLPTGFNEVVIHPPATTDEYCYHPY